MAFLLSSLKNDRVNAKACVYLQNSGLGNTINPLLSLCSQKARKLVLSCATRRKTLVQDKG